MTGFNAEAITRQVPNALTILRSLLAVAGAMALWYSYSWSRTFETPHWMGDPDLAISGLAGFAVGAFVVAALTDWLDGYLARRWSAESPLGAFLDPIADKLLVNGYLLVYVLILDAPAQVMVPVVAMILRDVAITLIRWSSPKGLGEAVRVSLTAKLKTALAIIVAGFPLLAFVLGIQNNGTVLFGWVGALWLVSAATT